MIYVENDANSGAYGEALAGGAKGYSDVIVVTLGTGVGGGIIIDGKIYGGFNHFGAELGHDVIVYNGRQCTCGRKGCLEAYASATGLINMTKEAMEAHKDSKLWEVAKTLDEVNGKTAFDAMRLGDPVGKAVVDEYIGYLGCGLSNFVNVFQPEVLLIGGGIARKARPCWLPSGRSSPRKATASPAALPRSWAPVLWATTPAPSALHSFGSCTNKKRDTASAARDRSKQPVRAKFSMGGTMEQRSEILRTLCEEAGCACLFDARMKDYTTFRIGGPAAVLLKPRSIPEICWIRKTLSGFAPIWFMGKGSNLLIPDEGVSGIVVVLGSDFSKVELQADGETLVCEAGASLDEALPGGAGCGTFRAGVCLGHPRDGRRRRLHERRGLRRRDEGRGPLVRACGRGGEPLPFKRGGAAVFLSEELLYRKIPLYRPGGTEAPKRRSGRHPG